MQGIPADTLPAMFFEPATHLLVGPCPFKGMGIEPIILWFGSLHVVHELVTTMPRIPFQIVKAKAAIQQFPLIEPRSMNRREAGPPPAVTLIEIRVRRGSRVTRVPILDQINPLEPMVPAAECCQSFRVMQGSLSSPTRSPP